MKVSPSKILHTQNMTEEEVEELVRLLGPATGAISSLTEQLNDPAVRGRENTTDTGNSEFYFLI